MDGTNHGAITVFEDRTFVLRDGVWVDTLYQPGTVTVKLPFAERAISTG